MGCPETLQQVQTQIAPHRFFDHFAVTFAGVDAYRGQDLRYFAAMVGARLSQVDTIVDRVVAAAHRKVLKGHTHGKIVLIP